MTGIHSIALGLPCCQNEKREQTKLSIGLRISVVALGAIAVIGAILILCHTPGLSLLGNTGGWTAFAAGGVAVIMGLSIQQKKEIRDQIPRASNAVDITFKEPSNQYESELQEGIEITQEIKDNLVNNLQDILDRKENDAFKLYDCRVGHRIFELTQFPDLVFKMRFNDDSCSPEDSTATRYQKMIAGKQICTEQQLDLLVIPNAKFLTFTKNGIKREVIVEKKLHIHQCQSRQEEDYEIYADQLSQAVQQLAEVICFTEYSDVEWRNNPIIWEEEGPVRIALVDFEEAQGAEIGLFGEVGAFSRRGLVGCLNKSLWPIVQGVAEKHHISTDKYAFACERREKELTENLALAQWHTTHTIQSGEQPIELPSNEEQEEIRALVQKINDKLKNSSTEDSLKARRYIDIVCEEDTDKTREQLHEMLETLKAQDLVYSITQTTVYRPNEGVMRDRFKIQV